MSISLTFTIPGGEDALAFKEKIRELSEAQGISMSEYIVEAIAQYMRNHAGT